MSTKLKNIIKYICCNYPHSRELSNARLTKMVYLCDWEYVRRNHTSQLTDITWYFNNYGPYVEDVLKAAKEPDSEINVREDITPYNTPKLTMIYTGDGNVEDILAPEEKKIVDYVINQTKSMYWNDFIKHVYNTFPIRNNPRYSVLDLIDQAAELREWNDLENAL